MDERLIKYALEIIRKRALSYDRDREIALANGDEDYYMTAIDFLTAYSSAATILEYAIEGNEECMRQFDYCNDES